MSLVNEMNPNLQRKRWRKKAYLEKYSFARNKTYIAYILNYQKNITPIQISELVQNYDNTADSLQLLHVFGF